MMYCPTFCRQSVRRAVLLLGVGALLHTLPLTAQTALQQQGDTASVVNVPPQLSGAAAGRSLQAVNTNYGTPSGQPTALRGAGSSREQQRAPYDTFTNAMADIYAAWYDAYLQNAANAYAYPVYPAGYFPGGIGGWPYAAAPPLPLFQTPPAGSPPPYS